MSVSQCHITGWQIFWNERALLENMVALSLIRKYGHYTDGEKVFFFNDKVEVDFYVPQDKLAIQVSYSISHNTETYARELEALKRLPKVLECERRVVVTYEEEDTLTDEYGDIEIIPLFRWLLNQQ